AGGPEEEARRRNRKADTATAAEVEMGRTLFAGERVLAGGGAACSACHRVSATAAGGSLGPDLSHAFAKFQDKGLAALLARGCFPRVPDSGAERPLTEQEAFALRAFLRRSGAADHAAAAPSTSKSQR